MCSTVNDVLGKSDVKRGAVAKSGLPAYEEKSAAVEEAGDFVLGDSDDEEERGLPPAPVDAEKPLEQPPPAYEDAQGVATGGVGDEKRQQVVLHYLKPQETLLGLSMQYKVDVRRLSLRLVPLSLR